MVFGGIAEDRTTNLGFLSDHDAFTRSDPAAPRRRPLAGTPGTPGRVDLGGCPPRSPTDPDVRVKRIWLFIS